MDADYLAQHGEGAAPQHEEDELSNFIAPSDDEDDDEDMGNSDVEVGYGDSEGEAEDEDDLDLDGPPAVPFNPVAMGLKEIGGLARFRVSSYKPGNGVEELINDDTERYWQYVIPNPSASPSSLPLCCLFLQPFGASLSSHQVA